MNNVREATFVSKMAVVVPPVAFSLGLRIVEVGLSSVDHVLSRLAIREAKKMNQFGRKWYWENLGSVLCLFQDKISKASGTGEIWAASRACLKIRF